jgi:hypothetical protein
MQPEDDGCGDADGGHEGVRAAGLANCDRASMAALGGVPHGDRLLAKRLIARPDGRPVTDEAPDILASEAELALAWSSPKVGQR